MFRSIAKAFKPLDTTEVDAAIASAGRAHRDVQVRARALRMDVGCGDPVEGVRRLLSAPTRPAGFLARLFPLTEDTPADMKGLLGKM